VKVGCRRLGMQHRNSVGRAVFLSKGQACRGVLPNEDLPDQKCRSRLDSAHGHSQTQRLYSLWHSVTINCRITVLSEMPVTGMQTMLSRLDSAHRHSQTQRLYSLWHSVTINCRIAVLSVYTRCYSADSCGLLCGKHKHAGSLFCDTQALAIHLQTQTECTYNLFQSETTPAGFFSTTNAGMFCRQETLDCIGSRRPAALT